MSRKEPGRNDLGFVSGRQLFQSTDPWWCVRSWGALHTGPPGSRAPCPLSQACKGRRGIVVLWHVVPLCMLRLGAHTWTAAHWTFSSLRELGVVQLVLPIAHLPDQHNQVRRRSAGLAQMRLTMLSLLCAAAYVLLGQVRATSSNLAQHAVRR